MLHKQGHQWLIILKLPWTNLVIDWQGGKPADRITYAALVGVAVLALLLVSLNSCVGIFFYNSCVGFWILKSKPLFSGWTTNKYWQLIAWICCPNSYFFEGSDKSMDFRPTSAKTSGEKNFRKNFYWLKRTAFEFHGDSLGVIFTFGYI